jgi:hypothetical protein
MFDPSGMYPDGFHPVKIDRKRNFKGKASAYARTQRPARYVLIDFGLSRQYRTREVLDSPLRGGDRSAPEHQSQRPCNPFHTDIYYIGNLVRENFLMVCDPSQPIQPVHFISILEISGLPIYGEPSRCYDEPIPSGPSSY